MTAPNIHIVVAYIDPGTGGVLLQLMIAALIGAGLYFRQALRKFISLFLRKPMDKKKDDHESR